MKIKKYFFTGLIAILPISLTVFITLKFFKYLIKFSNYVIPSSFYMINTNNTMYDAILTVLGYALSVISTIAFITFIGALTLNYFGGKALKGVERLIARIPLSRTVYSTVKQITELLFSKENAPYRKVVMVEYPSEGFHSVGFLTNESIKLKGSEENFVAVFIPTAPNPTTGFLVILKRDKVRDLNISAEDAAKLVISAGAIRPDTI